MISDHQNKDKSTIIHSLWGEPICGFLKQYKIFYGERPKNVHHVVKATVTQTSCPCDHQEWKRRYQIKCVRCVSGIIFSGTLIIKWLENQIIWLVWLVSLWCLTPLFKNISVISWRSVLLVGETGVPEKTTDLSQQIIWKYINAKHTLLYHDPILFHIFCMDGR